MMNDFNKILNSQSKYLFVITFLLILFYITPVFAQVADPGGGDGGGGGNSSITSSGTLVAAAFESMGYAAQQQVLQSMSEQIGELAGLIYLGVLVSAILTAGLMGSYAPSLWLIVGPPVFIFVSGITYNDSGNTISAQAPEWRFGAFEDSGGLKDRLTKGNVSQSEVSFVFHKYNEIISELYQTLISEITSDDVTKQLIFMARQRMIEDLFGMQINTPNTRSLLGYTLVYCAKELSYAHKIGQGRRNPEIKGTPEYVSVEEKYCSDFDRKDKRLPNQSLGEYLRESLEVEYEDGELISCLDLWNWSRIGMHKDIAEQGERALHEIFGPEISSTSEGEQVIQKVFDDIFNKIREPADSESSTGEDPCPFPGPDLQGVSSVSASFNSLTNIFSGLLLRKAQTSQHNETTLQQVMAGNFSGFRFTSDAVGKRNSTEFANDERMRRNRAEELSIANQYNAFTTIMFFPYLQAILLYILSVMFPFFALLIIVPGQASNFFTWMALWAWVKSWDVGWALVMVTDELLWEIMPHGTFVEAEDENYTPVTLMEAHFEGDYSYSSTFYWVLLAGMISAVPVITAQAILGSKKALASAFSRGFTEISSRLSSPAMSWTRNTNVRGIARDREQGQANGLFSTISGTISNIGQALKKIEEDHLTPGGALSDTPGSGKLDRRSGGEAGDKEATVQARDADKKREEEGDN